MSSIITQVARWVFTNHGFDVNFDYKEYFESPTWRIKRAVWGFELGAQGGRKHMQGYLELFHSARLNSMKKILPRAHWEPARSSAAANYKYCTKSGNFCTIRDFSNEIRGYSSTATRRPASAALIIAGLLEREIAPQVRVSDEYLDKATTYEKACHYVRILQQKHRDFHKWENTLLYPWQFKILQKLFTQNSRQILWAIDTAGNHGKSFLARYLDVLYDFLVLDGSLNTRDLGHMLRDGAKGFCFDVCRASIRTFDYSVLEAVKNGYIVSGKYSGQILQFHQLTVLVLANCEPDMTQLSRDRWNVVTLGEGDYSNMEKLPVLNARDDFPYVKPPPLPVIDENFDLRSFIQEKLSLCRQQPLTSSPEIQSSGESQTESLASPNLQNHNHPSIISACRFHPDQCKYSDSPQQYRCIQRKLVVFLMQYISICELFCTI